MPSFKERIDRHDREIAAIRKLVHTGMKLFVKLEEEQIALRREHIALRQEQVAFRKELRELAVEQRALIRALRRGSNGHAKRSGVN